MGRKEGRGRENKGGEPSHFSECSDAYEELTCSGNNFVFNTFLYLESVHRSENMVRTGGPGSRNNSKSKSILVDRWTNCSSISFTNVF